MTLGQEYILLLVQRGSKYEVAGRYFGAFKVTAGIVAPDVNKRYAEEFRGLKAAPAARALVARAVRARQKTTAKYECAPVSSGGRLPYGAPFVARLPAGLELRLLPGGDFGWNIRVSRLGGTFDYIWVVSPPFQTAPHRDVGPTYGLAAAESAAFTRHLRFVLTDREYQAALKIVQGQSEARDKMAALERLRTGSLTLHVERFALRDTGRAAAPREAFDWIEFRGEACVPRR